jgi:hypothetical protein
MPTYIHQWPDNKEPAEDPVDEFFGVMLLILAVIAISAIVLWLNCRDLGICETLCN